MKNILLIIALINHVKDSLICDEEKALEFIREAVVEKIAFVILKKQKNNKLKLVK